MAWFALAFFLVPLAEAAILLLGETWAHLRFKRAPAGKFTRLIVQVTTTGREQDRVNEIIRKVRSYREDESPLTMPLEVWVVNEPGQGDTYPEATRVVTVPADFKCRASYKARALEYARQLRNRAGLNTANLKILFLDDDVEPTKAYIATAFAGDFDLCQGITAPRIQYGKGPFKHVVLSHLDDLRTLACMFYCSLTQGVLQKPIYVHGEGLCVTGEAEDKVTWDYPVFASEDLVFGENAAHLGLSWGWFHEYIQITSPWTWKAFLVQRRRWLWGNLHAIFHRDVLPLGFAIAKALHYLLGTVTFTASSIGIYLILSGAVTVSDTMYHVFWLAFVAWLGAFALSGWINSGAEGTRLDKRIQQTILAVVLCPVTCVMAIGVLLLSLVMGNPKKFVTIAKTAATAANDGKHL
jgi:hypothetical protein